MSTEQQREKARTKKARQRERSRARMLEQAKAAALAEEARAAERERLAERLAPAVLRHPVMAPSSPVAFGANGAVWIEGEQATERMLLGPRVTIVDGRAVPAFPLTSEDDPIAKLGRESRQFTAAGLRAARLLRDDWCMVGGGLTAGAVDYLRVGGGGGGPDGPDRGMLVQIATRARLEAALTYAGAFTPALARVVLDCIPAYVWAGETGRTVAQAVAWLAAALDRLAGFYASPREPREAARDPIRTLAPPRETYQVAAPLEASDA